MTLVIYQRTTVVRATLWSIIGAYLLLPLKTEVDLPMIPPLDKVTIPNISAFLVCTLIMGKRVRLLPKDKRIRVLMLVYVTSPFITAFLNSDPIVAGPLFIDGMNSYDALSAVIRQLLFILPFLMGLQFFKTQKSLEDILLVLVAAAMWYSIPMLLEIRLSPQLHRWVYGYFPHSFVQQIRAGGFRPVVFVGHGLGVAFFTMLAFVASVILWRIRRRSFWNIKNRWVVSYLFILLLLCKSMASFVYGCLLLVLIGFVRPKNQIRIALLMVIIALTYPLTRGMDLFPVQEISEIAENISAERAHSFNFRVENENRLLDKTEDRPYFGWGTWGRNRVYDSQTGKDLSVTDGRWVIVMSQFGWIGLIAEFGLLALPVIRCFTSFRLLTERREAIVLAGFSLIMGISLLDLLPNNTMTPLTWLIAGAILSRTEYVMQSVQQLSEHKVPDLAR